jgi:hypothetical protein
VGGSAGRWEAEGGGRGLGQDWMDVHAHGSEKGRWRGFSTLCLQGHSAAYTPTAMQPSLVTRTHARTGRHLDGKKALLLPEELHGEKLVRDATETPHICFLRIALGV